MTTAIATHLRPAVPSAAGNGTTSIHSPPVEQAIYPPPTWQPSTGQRGRVETSRNAGPVSSIMASQVRPPVAGLIASGAGVSATICQAGESQQAGQRRVDQAWPGSPVGQQGAPGQPGHVQPAAVADQSAGDRVDGVDPLVAGEAQEPAATVDVEPESGQRGAPRKASVAASNAYATAFPDSRSPVSRESNRATTTISPSTRLTL